MNPTSNYELIEVINQSSFLSPGDKSYLVSQLDKLSPVDKLKLKHSLLSGLEPNILHNLQQLRQKFMQSEAPKEKGVFDKVVQAIFKPPSPQIASNSFLNQPNILGGPVPEPVKTTQIASLLKVSELKNLDQLRILAPVHVNFTFNENPDLQLQIFFEKSSELFDRIHSIPERRNHFLSFLSSPLAGAYFNTGLTALRHPELQPSSIVLNTLYQIDNKYLNNKQFRAAASISNHLRSLCGL